MLTFFGIELVRGDIDFLTHVQNFKFEAVSSDVSIMRSFEVMM